jgi:hypothetical protein
MNTFPHLLRHVLRIGSVAAVTIAGYEWCIRATASWLGVAVLPASAVIAALSLAALGLLAVAPLVHTQAERIGFGALAGFLAARALLEAVTGAFLAGIPPALVGATVGLAASLVSDGLPGLPRRRVALHRLTPLAPTPSSLGPVLRRAS